MRVAQQRESGKLSAIGGGGDELQWRLWARTRASERSPVGGGALARWRTAMSVTRETSQELRFWLNALAW